jgi:uncharacterized protein (DUF2384 family)
VKRQFQKHFGGPRLTPAEAERQGRVTKLALDTFGQSTDAVAFLNSHHDQLGGRPLDLAIASEEGILTVRDAILGLKN